MVAVKELTSKEKIWQIARILIFVLTFLLSLDLMGAALELLGKEQALTVIQTASNPFIGLFIGLLVTAIIQSSSTTTSIAVALVATGTIQFDTAVPIIMGANIGTTITATLVSLAFIGQKKKFKRALSVALSHHFFNVIVVLLLFPLEYYFGAISKISLTVTQIFAGGLLDANVAPNESPAEFSLSLWLVELTNGFIGLAISLILLVFSIKSLAKAVYDLIVSDRSTNYNKFLHNPYRSFSIGLLLTAGIQSSSTTTSFALPFVATGKISVKRIFPFILGANIGTTLTAFIATLFKSEVALVIAFAHLIFNLAGIMLFLPIVQLRNLPVLIARRFSALILKHRLLGFIYFILIFFVLPFTLIYLNRGN